MRHKVFTGGSKEVFEAVKKVLKELGVTIKSSDEKAGIISAYVAGSFFSLSYGNNIEVEISSRVWYESTLTVKSATAGFSMVDYGTNDDYEKKILNRLTKNLYKHEAFCKE